MPHFHLNNFWILKKAYHFKAHLIVNDFFKNHAIGDTNFDIESWNAEIFSIFVLLFLRLCCYR